MEYSVKANVLFKEFRILFLNIFHIIIYPVERGVSGMIGTIPIPILFAIQAYHNAKIIFT